MIPPSATDVVFFSDSTCSVSPVTTEKGDTVDVDRYCSILLLVTTNWELTATLFDGCMFIKSNPCAMESSVIAIDSMAKVKKKFFIVLVSMPPISARLVPTKKLSFLLGFLKITVSGRIFFYEMTEVL